jgi:hypothetical protein
MTRIPESHLRKLKYSWPGHSNLWPQPKVTLPAILDLAASARGRTSIVQVAAIMPITRLKELPLLEFVQLGQLASFAEGQMNSSMGTGSPINVSNPFGRTIGLSGP